MNSAEWFKIYRLRTDPSYGAPVCDICGKPVWDRPDLHHAIVMKRHVQGWPKKRRGLIDVPMNICVLHRFPCHQSAHGRNYRLLVAVQIVRYGWAAIDEWVRGLPFQCSYWDDRRALITDMEWHRGFVDDQEAIEIVEVELPWIL